MNICFFCQWKENEPLFDSSKTKDYEVTIPFPNLTEKEEEENYYYQREQSYLMTKHESMAIFESIKIKAWLFLKVRFLLETLKLNSSHFSIIISKFKAKPPPDPPPSCSLSIVRKTFPTFEDLIWKSHRWKFLKPPWFSSLTWIHLCFRKFDYNFKKTIQYFKFSNVAASEISGIIKVFLSEIYKAGMNWHSLLTHHRHSKNKLSFVKLSKDSHANNLSNQYSKYASSNGNLYLKSLNHQNETNLSLNTSYFKFSASPAIII
jgi:hypothetical protein